MGVGVGFGLSTVVSGVVLFSGEGEGDGALVVAFSVVGEGLGEGEGEGDFVVAFSGVGEGEVSTFDVVASLVVVGSAFLVVVGLSSMSGVGATLATGLVVVAGAGAALDDRGRQRLPDARLRRLAEGTSAGLATRAAMAR